MKLQKKNSLLGLILAAQLGCSVSSTRPSVSSVITAAVSESGARLPKQTMQQLKQSIFEVVIPKHEDEFVKYERSLPIEQLPFVVRNDHYISIGTAFTVGPNRYLSAAHVFRVGQRTLWTELALRDANGHVHKVANILKYSGDRDLVEFDLENPIIESVALTVAKPPEVGDEVITGGNAQGEGISFRSGQVSSFTPEEFNGRWKFIRFSAPASPGNSGGPLLNSSGQVVGVILRKNATENLNYAIPMSEESTLSSDKAEFVERYVQAKLGAKFLKRDWQFTVPLPMKVSSLQEKVLAAREGFYKSLLDDMVQQKKEDFPNSPGFREYLTHQNLDFNSGVIESDGQDRNWNIKANKFNKVELDNNHYAQLHQDEKNGWATGLFEKPAQLSLAEFIENSTYVMNDYLRASMATRAYGSERIRILSLGSAKEKKWWTDDLGRPWLRSRWFFQESDTYVESDCTPVPIGLYCVKTGGPTSYLSALPESFMSQIFDRFVFPYSGRLKDWVDYQKLAIDRRPALLKDLKFDFSAGQLKFKRAPFEIAYTNPIMNENSRLILVQGYAVKKDLEPAITLVSVEPDEKLVLQAYTKTAPLQQSSDDHKRKWQTLLNREDHYNGKVFLQADMNKLTTVVEETPKDKPTQAHLIHCRQQSSEAADKLAQLCEQFEKGAKFF